MTQSVAAIIVGIDGWEKYTKPLIQSIKQHEPTCDITVCDNLSKEPYPGFPRAHVWRHYYEPRLSYSAAINRCFGSHKVRMWLPADWTIVLSNDVLCKGPFIHLLEQRDGSDIVGPALKETHGFHYIEGWCVAIPRRAWEAVGGWDERFLGSDWEDVAFSTRARQLGFGLVEDLPFVHLDQRQRYEIVPDFWAKDAHNRDLFMREYAAVTA